MNRVYLSQGSIEMLLHNSNSVIEFIIKLYSAIITIDWDEIKSINNRPTITSGTAQWITDKLSEKFDQADVKRIWESKGFELEESLEDFYIGIPDNLCTLKLIYMDPATRELEEFFNEDDYDERQKIQKDL